MNLYTGGYLDVTPLLPAVTSKVHNNYNSSQSYPDICYTVLKSNPTYSSKITHGTTIHTLVLEAALHHIYL